MDNADTFHFHEAWQTIAAWFAEKADSGETIDRHAFLRKLQAARVIWYEPAAGREGARGVFQRLNSGKLPLEDGELVKALFLRSPEEIDVPAPWQLEIAREWDQIEAGLRDDRFWYLLNPRPRRDVPVRIGFIFDLVCQREDSDEERYFCYLQYAERFEPSEKAGELRSRTRASLAGGEGLLCRAARMARRPAALSSHRFHHLRAAERGHPSRSLSRMPAAF